MSFALVVVLLGGATFWQWPFLERTVGAFIVSTAEGILGTGDPVDVNAVADARATLADSITQAKTALAAAEPFTKLPAATAVAGDNGEPIRDSTYLTKFTALQNLVDYCVARAPGNSLPVIESCNAQIARSTKTLSSATGALVDAKAAADKAAADAAAAAAAAAAEAARIAAEQEAANNAGSGTGSGSGGDSGGGGGGGGSSLSSGYTCTGSNLTITFSASGGGTVSVSVSGAASGSDSGSGSASVTVSGGSGSYYASASSSSGGINISRSWSGAGSCS